MKTTRDLINKYDITRQTLNNWIKKEKIPAPKSKIGHQNVWTDDQAVLIDKNLVEQSVEQLSLFSNDESTLHIKNRRYLGSKQRMLDFIYKIVDENTTSINTVADIFGGTGVVADLFREKGKRIIVNDILTSNYISYQTWFGNEKVNKTKISNILKKLNNINGINGYVTKNFGNKYFSLENAKKIDAIREKIELLNNVNKREKSFLLTSLLYAMDKVANTVGHFDAYRKHMDSFKSIYLKMPDVNNNTCNEIYNMDANKLVRKIKSDLVYIDTPYNSRGYESAYHVLENVMEWKKPEVEGVAMKAVNRKEKSSDYTKSKAPIAFDDLIMHINAKYILVSYSNMAKKGNSRSNAKISNDEILFSLKKRGNVRVFETDFNAFTTGQSNINNHKELLYLCEVKKKYIEKNDIIQSALNYTGSKYKLLPQIKPLFPNDYKNFIDLFAGGGSVTVNLIHDNIANSYLMNDIEYHVIDLFEFLSTNSIEDTICKIEDKIEAYGLSNTSKNGYSFYGCNSMKGLGNYNKEKFLKLRKDYNESPNPILFYLLIVFGFNNQIRFNSKGQYNLPVGKRDFNNKMKSKLVEFSQIISNYKIRFSSKDYKEVSFQKGDFLYADPPYLISTASYNENGMWTKKNEYELYKYLDEVDKCGAKFALSNVILHKGQENEILKEWSNKYNLHVLNYQYNNSNYHSQAKQNETIEVLVTNYY
ncbi:Dam family site-specific DNA-(adenine-N6)-methyltransferase [Companilactobacillus baiquanensis]|uniref:Site-specific DNA-methyltransferase (adenine-specific) n=1 Tax=Companilactobacillus baiquanensis TaxID=2486005 RepID=A0ABW1V014_9LACO|nr:Dam family site-specific DNA-(adenine-N6)-methyltransferase [Companilactobacillus baiquanensis]